MHRHPLGPAGCWFSIPAGPGVEPSGRTKGDAPRVHPRYYEKKIGHECFMLKPGMLL